MTFLGLYTVFMCILATFVVDGSILYMYSISLTEKENNEQNKIHVFTICQETVKAYNQILRPKEVNILN